MNEKFDFSADIKGMNCSHCSAAVNEAIRGVPGVSDVEVKLDEKRAYIKGDASLKDAIVRAVKDAGFDAQI
ncbi:MAG: heavy-metal-associated domain-containing protein [Leptospirales bacterium]|nr:heavy-metal-associated domain-containing protein [Leptospirales bacterium]